MNKRTKRLISLGIRKDLKDEGYYNTLSKISMYLQMDLISCFLYYNIPAFINIKQHPVRHIMRLRTIGV